MYYTKRSHTATLYLFFGLVFFLCACARESTDGQVVDSSDSLVNAVKSFNVMRSEFSVVDTLEKYIGADTLLEYEKVKVYVGKTKTPAIGLLQVSDSSIIVYQKIKGMWEFTETLGYPMVHVRNGDLNGDDFADVTITHFFTGSGGNAENVCLLYDPSTDRFKHNRHYDLPNIRYDRNRNLVFAAWCSGGARPQSKMSYSIAGDSLVFKEGVTYTPDESNEGNNGTVEFYQMNKGKRLTSNRVTGNSNKIYVIFSKALWDTGDE